MRSIFKLIGSALLSYAAFKSLRNNLNIKKFVKDVVAAKHAKTTAKNKAHRYAHH